MGSHLVIIGKTGQLARALQKKIDGTKHTASFYDRSSLDLRACLLYTSPSPRD